MADQHDIHGVNHVEIRIRSDGKVVWVNVDGVCLFRCSNVRKIDVFDDRDFHEKPIDPKIKGAMLKGYEPLPCCECGAYTVVKNSDVLRCNTCGVMN